MIEMTIEESRALTVAINSLRFNPDLSDIETQSHEIVLSNMRNRMQEGKKNEPLTLEELRRMDGEPVWAELADGRREYGLVSVSEFDALIFIGLRNDVCCDGRFVGGENGAQRPAEQRAGKRMIVT